METLGAHGNPLTGFPPPGLAQTRLDERPQSVGDDDPMSDNDFSRDGDSTDGDALSRVPASDIDQETMEKLRQQEREEREEIEKELRAQNNAFMAAAGVGGSPPLAHLAALNLPGLLAGTDTNGNSANKEPPPLGLAGLEAFRREYLTSPLPHLRTGSGLVPTFPPLMSISDRSPFGKGHPSTPGHQSSHGSDRGPRTPPTSSQSTPSSEFSSQQNWSFEEQFKQLYELSDDQKRKEFLDDLFAFMQKRGSPINRLPIMAKQVLDLYELYNLVTARGGLVEVINKKQWQEIIKGLNLPSSITSAAFTLRTQYTKYLYPYECHMKNLSSPSELQAAIDGNRREGGATAFSIFPELGRRSGYDGYGVFSGPRPQVPLPPTSMISQMPMRPSFNGTGFHGASHGKTSPPGMTPTTPLSALEMTRLALFKMYNQAGLPHGPPPQGLPHGLGHAGLEMGRAMAEQQARAFQAAREAEQREKDKEKDAIIAAVEKQRDRDHRDRVRSREREVRDRSREDRNNSGGDEDDDDLSGSSSVKRERQDSYEGRSHNGSPIGGANIRIANRGDGGDSSLVVSLEINSVVYQGVLFAQPKSRSRSRERKENRIA